MVEAILIAKNGEVITRDALAEIRPPPSTDTWFPIAHNQVLGTVERTLTDAGYEIQQTSLALSEDKHRFFGTLTLGTQIHDGVSLAVGVRNSTDKSFPLGLIAGSRVFVCSNLAFSAEIYVSKKHTRFGEDRFNEGISLAIQSLRQYREVEAKRVETYRGLEITENQAAATLLHAFEEGVLSTRTLGDAIFEWREPSQEEFKPRTMWSLFNAFTSALSVRQTNPSLYASITMKLNGLLDRQIPLLAS